MKKMMAVLALSSISIATPLTVSSEESPVVYAPLSVEMSTTDIFNYLKSNLGLTPAQSPAVKEAVDQTGTEFTNLKASSPSLLKQAQTGLVNGLIKKLADGLTSGQSTKLSGMSGTLLSMFSQLKK